MPDGGRRRRRADRPPDVPAALARRGGGPELRDGSARARAASARDFDFIPTVCCAIDDDEARALDAARRTIAFYSTVRTYMPLWEMHGFADAAAAAGDAFRRGDLAAVPEAIPDEMVDTYTAAGPLDKVRARVAEVAERGDGVFLTPADLLHPAGADRRVPDEAHRGLRTGLNRVALARALASEPVDELLRASPGRAAGRRGRSRRAPARGPRASSPTPGFAPGPGSGPASARAARGCPCTGPCWPARRRGSGPGRTPARRRHVRRSARARRSPRSRRPRRPLRSPVDLVTGAVEDPPEEVGHEHVRLALVDQLGVLGRRYVELRAPGRECRASRRRRGSRPGGRVGVGEGVGRDLVPVELFQDPPGRLAAARVDQDVAGQVGVDRPRQARAGT